MERRRQPYGQRSVREAVRSGSGNWVMKWMLKVAKPRVRLEFQFSGWVGQADHDDLLGTEKMIFLLEQKKQQVWSKDNEIQKK